MNDLADFNTHRIEGFAHQGNTPFSVTLFSQIGVNLWMGGCPRGEAPEHFQFIVSLYPWEPYSTRRHQIVTNAVLFDSGELPDEKVLVMLARHVNECRNIGPTLVHCQAGLNRSGLITALALIKTGMKPQAAIELLREKRCAAVLCNRAFEGWLLSRDMPKLDFSA